MWVIILQIHSVRQCFLYIVSLSITKSYRFVKIMQLTLFIDNRYKVINRSKYNTDFSID
ncbi:hypothetical protein A1OE_488 [Candidatus Endolissoclinum faulkneri L2]|uniref:Uncharacterized protein n=1 Tax=Candidatus Endolissoclinum faulkneri L2 TaxID=1193729 RepID=K7ZCK9_9PROT|nr:hypothetical protein A1OE_488 [Candidatus Endolissoclinum faulkneri L2]